MTARPDLLGDLADELELDGSVTPHAAAVEAATALDERLTSVNKSSTKLFIR